MSTILAECPHTFLITEPASLSPDDGTWVEDLRAAVIAPAPTRYTVASPSAETLKITAAVSATASVIINLAASKNAVVTKLSDGTDSTKPELMPSASPR